MNITSKKMGDTIKKFNETIDEHFIKPKKEEYYDLVKHFKGCKQVIKDINFRKKIRRKNTREWLWTWVVFFSKNPRSAFYVLMNTGKDSEYFVKDYWLLKKQISIVNECINDLDDTLDQLELFYLKMENLDKKFETIDKKISEYDNG
tara:strand:- start:121 stop:561 length:441 start_codon:yes stop_codon:yes gene_type:complete